MSLPSSPSCLLPPPPREMTEKLEAVHGSKVAALQEEAGLVEGRHQAELGQLREELEATHLEEIQQLTEAHRSVPDISILASDIRILVSDIRICVSDIMIWASDIGIWASDIRVSESGSGY